MAPTIYEDDPEPGFHRHNRFLRHHSVINYAAGQQSREKNERIDAKLQRNRERSSSIKSLSVNSHTIRDIANKKCQNKRTTTEEDLVDSCSSKLMSFHNYAKRRKSNDDEANGREISSHPISSMVDENSVLSMSSVDEDLTGKQHHFDSSLPPQSLMSTAPTASITEIMSLYHRFSKTPKTCQQRNLFEIAMRTIILLQRNRSLQIRLHQLQMETRHFVNSVMSNPENAKHRHINIIKDS